MLFSQVLLWSLEELLDESEELELDEAEPLWAYPPPPDVLALE